MSFLQVWHLFGVYNTPPPPGDEGMTPAGIRTCAAARRTLLLHTLNAPLYVCSYIIFEMTQGDSYV